MASCETDYRPVSYQIAYYSLIAINIPITIKIVYNIYSVRGSSTKASMMIINVLLLLLSLSFYNYSYRFIIPITWYNVYQSIYLTVYLLQACTVEAYRIWAAKLIRMGYDWFLFSVQRYIWIVFHILLFVNFIVLEALMLFNPDSFNNKYASYNILSTTFFVISLANSLIFTILCYQIARKVQEVYYESKFPVLIKTLTLISALGILYRNLNDVLFNFGVQIMSPTFNNCDTLDDVIGSFYDFVYQILSTLCPMVLLLSTYTPVMGERSNIIRDERKSYDSSMELGRSFGDNE